MRRLIESLARFSWAMPVLGAQQLARAARPSRAARQNTSAAFDALSLAVYNELGPTLHSLYEVGDRLQRGALGAVFSLLPCDPGRLLDALTPAPGTRASRQNLVGKRDSAEGDSHA